MFVWSVVNFPEMWRGGALTEEQPQQIPSVRKSASSQADRENWQELFQAGVSDHMIMSCDD